MITSPSRVHHEYEAIMHSDEALFPLLSQQPKCCCGVLCCGVLVLAWVVVLKRWVGKGYVDLCFLGLRCISVVFYYVLVQWCCVLLRCIMLSSCLVWLHLNLWSVVFRWVEMRATYCLCMCWYIVLRQIRACYSYIAFSFHLTALLRYASVIFALRCIACHVV